MARRRKSKQREQEEAIQGLVGLVILGAVFFIYNKTHSFFVASIVTCVIIGIGLTIIIWIGMKRRERLRRSGIADVDKMEWRRFEHYLGELFKAQGYKAEVTQAAGDFGADLVITKENKKIVVQAKHSISNVGLKAVQEVHAAIAHYGASEGWVVTNRDYSEAAYKLAKSNNVRLIGREQLIEMMLNVNNPKERPTKQVASTANHAKGLSQAKEEICKNCGGILIKRKSNKGVVLACSNFPNCKNVRVI